MHERKRRPLLGNAMLLLSAVIWGSAFVAQREGMEHLGPFTFGCIRCALGAAFLYSAALARRLFVKKNNGLWIKGGILAGIAMFVPVTLQQYGLLYTSSGKAGFITALYMIIVPLYMLFFFRKRISAAVWGGAVLAVAGMYVMCAAGEDGFNAGDMLELISAFFWGVQILVIDRYADRADGILLVATECAVCSLLSLPLMLIFETVSLQAVSEGAFSLAHAGILSCGVAYALQPIGQRETSPAVAPIMMSMESVFAAVFGALIMKERFSPRELAGGAMIFAAVLIVQIPQAIKEVKQREAN